MQAWLALSLRGVSSAHLRCWRHCGCVPVLVGQSQRFPVAQALTSAGVIDLIMGNHVHVVQPTLDPTARSIYEMSLGCAVEAIHLLGWEIPLAGG